MIPIKNELGDIKLRLDKVRTEPQQIGNDAEMDILSKWYSRLSLVGTSFHR
jgi:hypothetical protein